MRYISKIPETDDDLGYKYLDEGWTKLKEPKSLFMAMVFAVPFMLLNGILSLLLSSFLYPPLKQAFLGEFGFSWSFSLTAKTLLQLIVIVLFMLIHEMIHASVVPRVWQSDKTVFGLNGLFGFVYTTEVISKKRFLWVSLMPLVMLSLVLPLLLSQVGLISGFMVLLFLINAMGSCVDCYYSLLIALRIPKGSVLVANGLETYYRAG